MYLSEMIGSLDDFTNSEKQKLFDLMNSPTLPELTKVDVTFSTKERGQEVVSKLIELSNADGEMEPAEKVLIEKIKSMM
jgi:tellurite resistance protein